MTEEIETELGRCRNGTNRADELGPVAPDRYRNGINREGEVIAAVPDRCKNGTHIGAKAAPVGRGRNGTRTGAETALEKLELEGRDRGRAQRGLFSRGKRAGPLPAGG